MLPTLTGLKLILHTYFPEISSLRGDNHAHEHSFSLLSKCFFAEWKNGEIFVNKKLYYSKKNPV